MSEIKKQIVFLFTALSGGLIITGARASDDAQTLDTLNTIVSQRSVFPVLLPPTQAALPELVAHKKANPQQARKPEDRKIAGLHASSVNIVKHPLLPTHRSVETCSIAQPKKNVNNKYQQTQKTGLRSAVPGVDVLQYQVTKHALADSQSEADQLRK
ncbi:hypothetical protein, partial [Enterobacter bugandensis]|uniref:hypothetical protein n=1 Tax=Enterobacter bugandensis TaxID=881260 RepID=UPI0006684D90